MSLPLYCANKGNGNKVGDKEDGYNYDEDTLRTVRIQSPNLHIRARVMEID